MDEEMWKLIQNTPLPSSEESDVQISSIEPEQGVEFESQEENKLNTPHSTVTHSKIYFEKDLPRADLQTNPLANVLGKLHQFFYLL